MNVKDCPFRQRGFGKTHHCLYRKEHELKARELHKKKKACKPEECPLGWWKE